MVFRAWLRSRDFYYGWVVTIACLLVASAVYSVSFSFGVFFDPILSEFQSSRANVSLVFSIQIMAFYVSALLIGSLADRYGARRLLAVGTVVYGAGLFATALTRTLTQVYVTYGVVAGTGMGILYLISYTTVPRWFHRRRGIASAIALSGMGLGTLAFPPIASFLINQHGWREAYFLVMFVLLALLGLAILVIADNPHSIDAALGDEFPAGHNPPGGPMDIATQLRDARATVASVPFAFVFLGFVLSYLPLFIILVYLVVYATDVGLPRSVGVTALSVMGGATIPGRLLVGYVSDRFGRPRLYIVTVGCLGAATIALPFIRSPGLLIGFAVAYGLLWGGSGGLISAIVADLFGTTNLNTVYAAAATGFGVGALAGPYAAGLVYEALGSYTVIFAGSGALGVLAAVAVFGAKRTAEQPMRS